MTPTRTMTVDEFAELQAKAVKKWVHHALDGGLYDAGLFDQALPIIKPACFESDAGAPAHTGANTLAGRMTDPPR